LKCYCSKKNLKKLAKTYQEIKLHVEADLIKDTHIATSIRYKFEITSIGKSFEFEFNAQTPNKPHIDFKTYLNHFIQQEIQASQRKESIKFSI